MPVKQMITCIIVLFCSRAVMGQNNKPDCSILKKGTFKYLDTDDTTSYVVINNKKHIEYHNNQKYYIKSDVTWLSDCEYKMTMTEITIPDFPFHPGYFMTVKVNRIENDIIYYTSTVNGRSWDGKFKHISE